MHPFLIAIVEMFVTSLPGSMPTYPDEAARRLQSGLALFRES